VTVEGNRELTSVAVDQLDLDPGFLPQQLRHTGGGPADRTSDGALPDNNLLHRTHSFPIRPSSKFLTIIEFWCKSRAKQGWRTSFLGRA
jgi:hypothetical protein